MDAPTTTSLSTSFSLALELPLNHSNSILVGYAGRRSRLNDYYLSMNSVFLNISKVLDILNVYVVKACDIQ